MKNRILAVASITLMLVIFFTGCNGTGSSDKNLMGTWKVVSAAVDKQQAESNMVAAARASLARMIYQDGTMIIFKDRNKVDLVSYNAATEYKLDGNKLSFKDAQTGQWSPDYFEYEINADSMTWKMSGLTLNLEKQK